MARKRLFLQLYVQYLIVLVLSMALAVGFAFWTLRDFYRERTRADLEARARLVEPEILSALSGSPEELNNLCRRLGHDSGTRITVILPSGKVVGDSDEFPSRMDNHADRPEIRAAFEGRTGSRIRYSHTLRKEMVYVAIPLAEGGRTVCALRTSMPTATLTRGMKRLLGRVLLFVLLVAVTAMIVSLVFSRRISRPIEEVKQGALRFARGELDTRLIVPDAEELGGLAEAMNTMAAQLDERIRAISRQRREKEAILSSMTEGVVAVNKAEEIISINRAACHMLRLDPERGRGRSIQEAVRNTTFHTLVAETLASRQGDDMGQELEMAGGSYLQAHGTVLRDADGAKIGAVIVLNDVTQLRKLESHRRDFVANVSHELRTPITSIKGFVETLLDGALESPEDAQRFLNIISRQVDQLNAIIEDLLVLSRIEQDGERDDIQLEAGNVRDVLESAIEVCGVKSVEKDVSVGLSCERELCGTVHFALLTQAVVNLLDNAINYSPAGSSVHVSAEESVDELRISVRDQGSGIASEHLPRLTERFYRVDKARSRKMGGTGLGLAIVKHIVQAHRGRLSVESTQGRGTTFTIHLPKLS